MDPKLLGLVVSKLEQIPEGRDKLADYLQSQEISDDLNEQAQEIVEQLLATLQQIPASINRGVKIYMASCMDIIHSGHFNALRQGKSLGDILIVGVIADDEIRRCKGPPVMSQDERAEMIRACKWVDDVIVGVEYYVTPDILDRVQCDYVAHGDDIAIRKDTGTDAYADVRAAGKLKIIKRTEGVSTTEMVGKMLLMTSGYSVREETTGVNQMMLDQASRKRSMMGNARRIKQFANGVSPKPTDRVVYIDGSFDLIHLGHISTLRKAKELGDYLIVGVHDDITVNEHKGKNYPIMNVHERTLNLLAIRYVDDVIMGAPWAITEDMIKNYNISVVVAGSNLKNAIDINPGPDPYVVAKEKGIYVQVESSYILNAEDIVDRIIANRRQYEERNSRMVANEDRYYETREYVQEL